MSTTEVVVEQVIIGLLIIFIITTLAFGTFSVFGQLGASTLLVLGAAYLAGILYDRFGDTILEDIDKHQRLAVAIAEIDKGNTSTDPFAEDELRINVMREEAAWRYADYLRTRMRITRAAATLSPALLIGLACVIYLPDNRVARGVLAAIILASYAGAFLSKLMTPVAFDRIGEERARPWQRVQLPRTSQLREPVQYEGAPLPYYQAYRKILSRYQSTADRQRAKPKANLRFFLSCEPALWALVLLTTLSLLVLAITTRQPSALVFPLLGAAGALATGWAWWRISGTFRQFLRDWRTYGSAALSAKPTIS